MYYIKDSNQISLDEFFFPFGGHLHKDNRWIRLVAIMTREHIEEIYLKSMSQEAGRRGYIKVYVFTFASRYVLYMPNPIRSS